MIKYLVLILSCFTLCVSAQERFFKQIDKNNDNNNASSIEVDSDSGYWISIRRQDGFTQDLDGAILKLNSEGTIIHEDYFGWKNYDYLQDILLEKDGVLGVTAVEADTFGNPDIIFFKHDFNGDSIWEKGFGGAKYDIAKKILKLHSHYYLIGSTESDGVGEHNVYIIKSDTLGNLIWEKTYGGPKVNWVEDAVITLDGNLVLAGITNSKFPGDTLGVKAYVLKIDTAGNLLWQESISENTNINIANEAYCITITQEGGYIIGGIWGWLGSEMSPYLSKLDSNGKRIWFRQLGTAEGLQEQNGGDFAGVTELPDKSIVASGTITYMDSLQEKYRSEACLWKFDSAGNTIWRRTYPGPGIDNNERGATVVYNMLPTPDGGFVMCGRFGYDYYTQADAIVIKVDSFGCLEPGCQLTDGINTFSNQILQVKAYPNPSNGALTFSWNQALQKESTLLISDLTGRTVYTKTLYPSETRHHLQKGILKEGMYLYRLHSPGLNSTAGKLIITE